MKLNAWGMVNNSNQSVLEFVASKQEKLKIANVRTYPNSFRANGVSTTFAFEHKQRNTELLV